MRNAASQVPSITKPAEHRCARNEHTDEDCSNSSAPMDKFKRQHDSSDTTTNGVLRHPAHSSAVVPLKQAPTLKSSSTDVTWWFVQKKGRIGKGGFGHVFEGFDYIEARDIAIKIVAFRSPHRDPSKLKKHSAVREVKVHQKLSSMKVPGIVGYIGYNVRLDRKRLQQNADRNSQDRLKLDNTGCEQQGTNLTDIGIDIGTLVTNHYNGGIGLRCEELQGPLSETSNLSAHPLSLIDGSTDAIEETLCPDTPSTAQTLVHKLCEKALSANAASMAADDRVSGQLSSNMADDAPASTAVASLDAGLQQSACGGTVILEDCLLTPTGQASGSEGDDEERGPVLHDNTPLVWLPNSRDTNGDHPAQSDCDAGSFRSQYSTTPVSDLPSEFFDSSRRDSFTSRRDSFTSVLSAHTTPPRNSADFSGDVSELQSPELNSALLTVAPHRRSHQQVAQQIDSKADQSQAHHSYPDQHTLYQTCPLYKGRAGTSPPIGPCTPSINHIQSQQRRSSSQVPAPDVAQRSASADSLFTSSAAFELCDMCDTSFTQTASGTQQQTKERPPDLANQRAEHVVHNKDFSQSSGTGTGNNNSDASGDDDTTDYDGQDDGEHHAIDSYDVGFQVEQPEDVPLRDFMIPYILEIKMEFANAGNLASWIAVRNKKVMAAKAEAPAPDDRREITVAASKRTYNIGKMEAHIFRQVVEGLAGIHKAGYIHRDIKPANVLLHCSACPAGRCQHCQDGDGLAPLYEAKICDFGHAVNLNERSHTSEAHQTSVKNPAARSQRGRKRGNLTKGTGTSSYIAPEQAVTSNYSYPVDMFSAGLLLLELFHPTSGTVHEKCTLFQDARAGKLPEQLTSQFPIEARLIQQLLQRNPALRPSAEDLLREFFLLSLNHGSVQESFVPTTNPSQLLDTNQTHVTPDPASQHPATRQSAFATSDARDDIASHFPLGYLSATAAALSIGDIVPVRTDVTMTPPYSLDAWVHTNNRGYQSAADHLQAHASACAPGQNSADALLRRTWSAGHVEPVNRECDSDQHTARPASLSPQRMVIEDGHADGPQPDPRDAEIARLVSKIAQLQKQVKQLEQCRHLKKDHICAEEDQLDDNSVHEGQQEDGYTC